MTPGQAARHFATLAATAAATERLGRTLMAEEVKRSVKAEYGDATRLKALAPYTQEQRVRLGYTPNDPLLRDGSLLRDSIVIEYRPRGFAVGSDEPVANWQEFGFFNVRANRPVPPRPAIAIGAALANVAVLQIMRATAMALLGKRSRFDELAFAAVEQDV